MTKTPAETLTAFGGLHFEAYFKWNGHTVGIAKVGPALAEQLLATYKVNYRKHFDKHSEVLAGDMMDQSWIFAGDPIKLGTDQDIMDGQHRLKAVIKSGEPQYFLFVCDLSHQVYDVTDTGKGRTYADLLRQREYINTANVAALLKMIYTWNAGLSLDTTGKISNHKMDKLFHYGDESEEGKRKQDTILRSVQLSAGHRMLCPPTVLAFCWWLFLQIDVEGAHQFLGALMSGENHHKGMPSYTLRERLLEDREIYYSRNQYLYMIFQAWNSFRDNKPLARVTLTRHDVSRTHLNSRLPH